MSLWKLRKKQVNLETQSNAAELGGFPVGLSGSATTTDNDLVREFIGGNDAAFTQLVTKYKDALTKYLNAMVGNPEIAADLSQETFLRVYKNIRRYSNIYQFSTWIYRIATNLAIDEMRYRKRRGQVFYRNIWGQRQEGEDSPPEYQILDARSGPRDEILRKESSRILSEAIQSLPEKYRVVFVMKEVQEMPYEDIGKILNCSTGTVKSRLHRARALLQRKLEFYR
jgi:RNA polymerase sigma-70 factor, ECF subfamily